MVSYITRRLAQIGVTLFLFHALIFLIIQAQPGDIVDVYTPDENIRPEERARIRHQFGLDKPIWQQYLIHLKNTFSGNLGVSFDLYPRSVMDVIKERLPRTVMLFATATVASFYLGFALGKLIAWRRGSVAEYVATLGGVTLYTVFVPWFALMMIWLFAFKAGWFPLGKFLDPALWRDAPVEANQVFNGMLLTAVTTTVALIAASVIASRSRWRWRGWVLPGGLVLSSGVTLLAWDATGNGYLAIDIVRHMALPVITLTLISFAGTMLLTRSSMLETMREDYVLAARAKGLPERVVRDRHVARNALLPVVTSFAFSLAFAIDGGVIAETIFSWPGMGMTIISATQAQDLPLALGAFVFTGMFALAAHLAADVIYVYLDPRIRY